jgi:hypothetical protein
LSGTSGSAGAGTLAPLPLTVATAAVWFFAIEKHSLSLYQSDCALQQRQQFTIRNSQFTLIILALTWRGRQLFRFQNAV